MVSELNQRPIDIGTANAIELRHVSRAAAPAPAVQAPATPAARHSRHSGSGDSNSEPGCESGAPSFLFDPGQITAVKGNTFVVNLLISGAQNVYSVPVQMNYDPPSCSW